MRSQVTGLWAGKDLGVAVVVLHCIGTHFAPFLDHFFLRVFELVRKLTGSLKACMLFFYAALHLVCLTNIHVQSKILELILWRAGDIPDLFKRLQPLLGSNSVCSNRINIK